MCADIWRMWHGVCHSPNGKQYGCCVHCIVVEWSAMQCIPEPSLCVLCVRSLRVCGSCQWIRGFGAFVNPASVVRCVCLCGGLGRCWHVVLCGKHNTDTSVPIDSCIVVFWWTFHLQVLSKRRTKHIDQDFEVILEDLLTQQTLPMKYTRFAPRCTASSRHHGNRKVQRKDFVCQIVGVLDRLRTCRSPGAGLVKHAGAPSTSNATVVSFHDNSYLNFRVRRHRGTCFWATARRSRIDNCVPWCAAGIEGWTTCIVSHDNHRLMLWMFELSCWNNPAVPRTPWISFWQSASPTGVQSPPISSSSNGPRLGFAKIGLGSCSLMATRCAGAQCFSAANTTDFCQPLDLATMDLRSLATICGGGSGTQRGGGFVWAGRADTWCKGWGSHLRRSTLGVSWRMQATEQKGIGVHAVAGHRSVHQAATCVRTVQESWTLINRAVCFHEKSDTPRICSGQISQCLD